MLYFYKIVSFSSNCAISIVNQLEVVYGCMLIVILVAISSILRPELCTQTDRQADRQTDRLTDRQIDGTKNNTSIQTWYWGGGKYVLAKKLKKLK